MRQWAAYLLGLLEHDPAVPELTALAARLRADGIPPGEAEPVAVHWSLTSLGARQPVLPEVESTSFEHRPTGDVWLAARLEELLRALAAARQVILGFQLWRRHERFGLTWERHEEVGWEFDRAADWSDNVAAALFATECEADALTQDRDDLVVTIEWIDASDQPAAQSVRVHGP